MNQQPLKSPAAAPRSGPDAGQRPELQRPARIATALGHLLVIGSGVAGVRWHVASAGLFGDPTDRGPSFSWLIWTVLALGIGALVVSAALDAMSATFWPGVPTRSLYIAAVIGGLLTPVVLVVAAVGAMASAVASVAILVVVGHGFAGLMAALAAPGARPRSVRLRARFGLLVTVVAGTIAVLVAVWVVGDGTVSVRTLPRTAVVYVAALSGLAAWLLRSTRAAVPMPESQPPGPIAHSSRV